MFASLNKTSVPNRIVSISDGPMWRFNLDHNRRIDVLRRADIGINGVEICLPYKEDVFGFRPSDENLAWLRSLPWVTIHAPFGRDGDMNEKMRVVCDLYKIIGAKNVVIHPDVLPCPGFLKEYPDVRFATENLPPRCGISRTGLREIFSKYPDLLFCLDVTHAYRWSVFETSALISEFQGRLVQVHLSGGRGSKEHLPIKNASILYMLSIRRLFNMDVPLVMELDFSETDPEDIVGIFKGEMTFYRKTGMI